MTFWARVNQFDEVVEVADEDPTGRFHPSLIWRELPAGAEYWITSNFKLLEDGSIDAPIDTFQQRFLGDVAGIRWVKENETIIFEDEEVWCDRNSVAILTATKEQISSGNITNIEWKCRSGNYITLDATKLQSLLDAIMAHRIKTFKAEKIIREEITAMTDPLDFIAYNLPERYETEFNNI
jgi:hypothetical protein